MHVYSHFRAFDTMNVLVAAKYTANAVVQNCKVQKSPKRVYFDLQVQISKPGLLYFE